MLRTLINYYINVINGISVRGSANGSVISLIILSLLTGCVSGSADGSVISVQCWALAPLLAPPRHWRELRKVANVAVALKQKIMARWQWRENKMVLIRAISAPFSNQIFHINLDKVLFFYH